MSTTQTLSWVLGISSVYGLWLAGKHDWRGWALTAAVEPIWGVFSVMTRSWGLLVATFAYFWVSVVNLVRWKRKL